MILGLKMLLLFFYQKYFLSFVIEMFLCFHDRDIENRTIF